VLFSTGDKKMSNFDDVIDPELNIDALAEALATPIPEGVTILALLNGAKVKVRYLPQSIATSLEFDDGTPIQINKRKPTFNYKKFFKDILPKMNALALKNIRLYDDLSGAVADGKNWIPLSLISPGEYSRLRDLCFPGADDDSDDSENQDNAASRKSGKGVRRGKSDAPGEGLRAI
jgi:hypothetical protein